MDYDVMIIGAGAVGAAAAIRLARNGVSVALIDKGTLPRPAEGIGWVGLKTAEILEELNVDHATLLGKPFTNIRFIDSELARDVNASKDEGWGYVINRSEFDAKMVEAALQAGAKLHDQCDISSVIDKDDHIRLESRQGNVLLGRTLLIASGRQSPLAEGLGVARPVTLGKLSAVYMYADLPAPAGDETTINAVLGLGSEEGFGLFFYGKDQWGLQLRVPGNETQATALLKRFCSELISKTMIPTELANCIPNAIYCPPPALALDMDSHVGKHTLLIGEAGGFVTLLSNAGIVPGLWSATLAADVTMEALNSAESQDALMTFDNKWRLEMADYLRKPESDLAFLLPLVFAREAMAEKYGNVFFGGANI